MFTAGTCVVHGFNIVTTNHAVVNVGNVLLDVHCKMCCTLLCDLNKPLDNNW